MDSMELRVQRAIGSYERGFSRSYWEAANEFNVSKSTVIRRRNRLHKTHRESHVNQQRLTSEQESFLKEWIICEAGRGLSPSFGLIRQLASYILAESGDDKPLGQNWHAHFLARNKEISSLVQVGIESNRYKDVTESTIHQYLDLFISIVRTKNIPIANIWNMDESGLNLAEAGHQRVVGPSAAGKVMSPLIIFEGKNLIRSWFPYDTPPDWFFDVSENGWTSNRIGMDWLTKVFVPTTKIGGRNEEHVLVVDGHGSHVTPEFMAICRANKIYPIYLPAHASHLLQPLDLSCFSPIKARYRSEIANLQNFTMLTTVSKPQFISALNQARKLSLTKPVVLSGWRASGMVPFNPNCPLANPRFLEANTPSLPHVVSTHETSPKLPILLPRSSREIHSLLDDIPKLDERDIRWRVREVGRSMDRIVSEKAELNLRLKKAEAELGERQKRTRQTRVRVDYNDIFATGAAVMSAGEGMGERGVDKVVRVRDEVGITMLVDRFDPRHVAEQTAAAGFKALVGTLQF